MAKLLKLRRGTTSQHSSFTGAEGEVTVDTTKDTIVVHDGSTAGGVPLAKESDNLSLIDEDNMATDSNSRPPSQQSVKAYVDAKVPTSITVADESSDTTCFPLFVTAATGDLAPKTGTNFTFNSSTGKVVIGGDLQVQGTTTTVDSTTMTVADKNIEIAKGAANDAAADGGGITLESGDGNKTITWTNATDTWDFNQAIKTTAGEISILGTEGNSAILKLTADEGDDNADYWRFVAGSDGDFTLDSKSTGSWVTALTFAGSGNATFAGTSIAFTGSITDSKGDVRDIPNISKTSAYTLIASDAGKVIYTTGGGVTVPNGVFAAGKVVTIINNSGSDQTITQGSSFTLYNAADASTGNRTLAGRGMATIWFSSSAGGYISGAGLS